MNQKIKQAILKALLACDGLPMPESALFSAVETYCRPSHPTQSDISAGISMLEIEQFILGTSDDISGTSWMLSVKGTLKARQL